MTLSLSPDIKTRRGQRHEKCFTSRRTPGAPFCWACFASSVKENLAGESVVETAGAVEKPKNGFPTAPWTFGPQFPQRRLLLVLLQTQLFFYSRYWLWAIPTHHWHPCFSCGEGIEERLIRLLRIALADGTVGLADEWAVMMDDANVENVIRALDEIEAPPSWEQWKNHYDNECPARKKRLQLEEV